MRAGRFVRTVDFVRQRAIQNVVHQRRFPAAGDARHNNQPPQRELDVDPFQVVLAGIADANRFAVARAAFRRNRDGQRAGKIPAGQRRFAGADFIRSSARHQFAAQPPRARAEIDHVIGALDRLRIVFDDEHRVAHVAQGRQGIEQAVVIARMQADRRLIEHIEHSAQLRADLRGEANSLRFPAR